MWFCAYFKPPTQGVLNHSFLSKWNTEEYCHSIFVIFFEGLMTTTLFKAITIPLPDGRWSHSTTNTETLTLEGLIKSLWWTMTLGKFSGVLSAATVLNKQHFYCWKKSTHALTSCYLVLSAEGDTDKSFFSLFWKYCLIQKWGFLGVSKSHTLLVKLSVPQRNILA